MDERDREREGVGGGGTMMKKGGRDRQLEERKERSNLYFP